MPPHPISNHLGRVGLERLANLARNKRFTAPRWPKEQHAAHVMLAHFAEDVRRHHTRSECSTEDVGELCGKRQSRALACSAQVSAAYEPLFSPPMPRSKKLKPLLNTWFALPAEEPSNLITGFLLRSSTSVSRRN